MWSTATVDEELCVMITWTTMMPKFSVGCLVFLVVQLYWALENNSIERHAEVNYHCRSGTVCDNYLDNNDAQVLCRMLGFTVGTALQDLGEQYL